MVNRGTGGGNISPISCVGWFQIEEIAVALINYTCITYSYKPSCSQHTSSHVTLDINASQTVFKEAQVYLLGPQACLLLLSWVCLGCYTKTTLQSVRDQSFRMSFIFPGVPQGSELGPLPFSFNSTILSKGMESTVFVQIFFHSYSGITSPIT